MGIRDLGSVSNLILSQADLRRKPVIDECSSLSCKEKLSILAVAPPEAHMRTVTIAIGNYGLTKPLLEGSVESGQLKLRYIQIDPITAAMRRMVQKPRIRHL